MFVQIIRVRVKDQAGADAAMQRWERELRPGATGWLGTTRGTTADGELVTVVRFASEADARKNQERPEQGAWWDQFSKTLDGDATFFDSGEVTEFGGGGSDDAGFVQIMQGRATDKARMKALDAKMEAASGQFRPDVIGGITAWNGDDFATVIYFTSEADARKGEAASVEGEMKTVMDEMNSLISGVSFIDLSEPELISP